MEPRDRDRYPRLVPCIAFGIGVVASVSKTEEKGSSPLARAI